MLIYNAIGCLHCFDVIESIHVHDFKMCKCGKVGVDGGLEYAKRTGNQKDYIELAMFHSNDNKIEFSMLRHIVYRTGYGKPGSVDYGKARKTILKDMSDDHLQASLIYPGVTKGGDHWQLLLEEKLYRIENEISIADA